MAGLRWGIIAFSAAFVLSFLLGLIAQNQFLRIFITALLFGFIFFGMGMGIRVLVNNFFPEMAFSDTKAEDTDSYEEQRDPAPASGSGTTANVYGEFAVPDMYKIPGKPLELGNIEDLISGVFAPHPEPIDERLDQKPQEEYNDEGSFSGDSLDDFPLPDSFQPQSFQPEPRAPAPAEQPANSFTPSFGDGEGLGGLPELDSFAMVFSSGFDQDAGSSGSSTPRDAPSGDSGGFSGFVPGSADDVEPDRSQYKGNKPQALEGDFDAKALAQGIRTTLAKDK